MNSCRLALVVALATAPGLAFAQEGGAGSRGSAPPGVSQDGSRPSEGALKGGSVLPGETGGVPDTRGGRRSQFERCKQLEGELREQCLRDAGTSGGATGAAPAGPIGRDPVTAPPPQNPR